MSKMKCCADRDSVVLAKGLLVSIEAAKFV